MNKEELMRNLEYTERKHRNDTVNTFDTDISMMCSDVLRVLRNCIEIPKGATNGDIIKIIFPDVIISESEDTVHLKYPAVNSDPLFFVQVSKSWWNSPYKVESEDKK